MLNNLKSPRWTKEEEKLLVKLVQHYSGWDDIPYLSISDKYFPNRTVSAIKSKMKRLEKRDKPHDFSRFSQEENTSILRAYLSGKSYKDIKIEFELDTLDEAEQLCSHVTEPLKQEIRAYAEEHGLELNTFSLYKIQQFIKLSRKPDQFSQSALKRTLNG